MQGLKRSPHCIRDYRVGLVTEWGHLLNSQHFRRNSIARIDHKKIIYSSRVQFSGLPIKIFLLEK